MHDKIKNLLLEKDINIPKLLFYNLDKLDITFEEFYYLVYFINNDNNKFDLGKVSLELSKKPKDILKVINDLNEKKLLKLEVVKEDITYEILNLKSLYDKLVFLIIDKQEKEEPKIDLIKEIEKVFKRNLIAREKKIVSAWAMAGYNDDFVLAGLKEAEYNKEYSLTYIDTILDNWEKQGLKNQKDLNIDKGNIENQYLDLPNIDIEDGYNWMNE